METDIEKETPKIVIAATISREVSFAGHQNSIPLIRELTIINGTEVELKNIVLSMDVAPDFVSPKTWNITSLEANDEISLRDRDTKLNAKFLLDLTEQMKGDASFVLRSGDEEIARKDIEIRLLARNEWGGSNSQPELLAAFSMPNDPAVDKIISNAIDVLRRASSKDVMDGYTTKNRDDVWRQVSAVWSSVAGMNIKYALPPASFESRGQKIRLPSNIAQNSISTCLDTTMLFCSVLEQMKLHPFVVLTKDHAMAGVWLQPDVFPSLPMEDVALLRKRKDLNELLVFETTLATREPPASFKQAVAKGSDRISEAFEDDFKLVVDIQRARDRQIQPLALTEKVEEGPLPDTISILPLESPDISLGTFSSDFEEEETDAIFDRIYSWQRKLLDLTLRNPLLNFKSSQTNIPIICPKPSLLEDILAAGKKISISAIPDLTEAGGRDAEIHNNRTGADLVEEYALRGLEAGRAEIYVNEEKSKLEGRLLNLYRKAKNDLEEGGTNTLFLAVGTLSYVKEDRKGRVFKAPLILVPVELHRKSARSGLKLSLHDDEARFNTTLLEMLKEDFGLAIPGLEGKLPGDQSGIDVDKVWNTVRKRIVDIEGFEVKEEIYLGTFSFAKYLMWKDLVDRTDMLRDSPVVKHLIDRQSGDRYEGNDDAKPPEPGRLDREIDPKDLFTPLPADSSQLSAIIAADMGKDFVIIGPPGTGKSQTISNMISQLLANRKKVLFVSEKAAALNVVYRRLKDVGLSDFCLELHSNKAKKIDVLKQFNSAWNVAETMSDDAWLREAEKIKTLRDRLNGYVEELHKKHKNGLTVHRAIGEVVKHKDLPKVALNFPSADHHSFHDLEEIRSVIHEMKVNAEVLEDLRNHPLSVIETFEWSNAWQNKIAGSANDLHSDLIRLQLDVSVVIENLKIGKNDISLEKLEALIDLAGALLTAGKIDMSFALEPNIMAVIKALSSLKGQLSTYAIEKGELSVKYKEHPWKSVPIEEFKSRLARASQAWWPKSFYGYRSIEKDFMLLAGAHQKPDISKDISHFEKMKKAGEEIEKLGEIVKTTEIWRGYQTSGETIDQYLKVADKMLTAISRVADTSDELIDLKVHLKGLIGPGRELLSDVASVGLSLRKLVENSERFHKSLDVFSVDASRSKEQMIGAYTDGLKGLEQTCKHIRDNQSKLNSWCAWQSIRRKSVDMGFAPVVEAFEQGLVHVDRLEDFAEASYCRWWGSLKIDESEILRTFNSLSHTDAIERFRELDDNYRKLSAGYARAKICENIPDKEDVATNSEEGKIRRILSQTRPRKTVRAMIEDSPNFITELTPCVLMSPLSIAQYLPADFKAFDVVIFDEASQITVWDAVGSIARAKQTIIAGDPKQMPPSNNFGRGDSVDDSINDDEKDLDSILDEMLSAGIPQRSLNWHYRSRDESLITFSNHQYYEGKLITFPSPSTDDKAVSLVRVNGIYAMGQGRTNIIEARAVVARVVEKLLDPDFNKRGLSIGVVTFNTEQQQLILNLLDKERKDNTLIDEHFSEDRLEPVFVKNLESVQGDERHIIIFSLTFGKKAEGARMGMNFGPMNKVGGERRLNVAITRAKEEMIVFSSFDADEIDLSRTSAVGVAHLKHFVDYAARGMKSIGERVSGSVGGYDSPFEETVAGMLQKKGWIVHPQIGVSAFRIDIGVVHPDFAGAYLAGVECDGATYHSSATARDRDKIRESVLNGLGWNLVRVWSTDFWNDADGEIERLDTELNRFLEADLEKRAGEKQETNAAIEVLEALPELERKEIKHLWEEIDISDDFRNTEDIETLVELPHRKEKLVAENAPILLPKSSQTVSHYEIFGPEDTKIFLDPNEFYEDTYRVVLHKLIKEIVEKEAPVSVSELIVRVSRLHGFARAGATIRRLVESMINRGFKIVKEGDKDFIWPYDMDPRDWVWARDYKYENSKRDIDEIAMEELVAFAQKYKSELSPIDAIRNALGYARLSTPKKKRIERALQIALRD